jgi:hypothetical protein
VARLRQSLTPAQHAQLTQLGHDLKAERAKRAEWVWKPYVCGYCARELRQVWPAGRREGYVYLECHPKHCRGFSRRPRSWSEMRTWTEAAIQADDPRIKIF